MKRSTRDLPSLCNAAATAAFLVVSLAALLAGCGGGSGGNAPTAAGTGQTPPPAAQPALTITGFTPAAGAAGTVVAVRGTGLDAITAASLGSLSASFRIVSAAEVQVTVPAGATSGRIGLSAGGRAATSGADFTVAAAPAPAAPSVTAVSPTAVIGGNGRLVLTGTALDQVASARLGTVALTIASQSATSLGLDVPTAASSGTLTLTDRAGTARPVAQPITVVQALALTAFTPSPIARGQTLTLNGRGLDRASEVRFGGAASASGAAITGRTGSTALTVMVPAAATTGTLTVLAAAANGLPAEQVVSATALTVLEPIVVTPQTYAAAASGATVTVSGTGLQQVNAVTLGGVAAPISAQTATTLAFTVPAGVTCGALVLRANGLPDVNAGSVVVGAGCAARAAAVEFAQLMSQPAGDRYQRLAAGRETWVRAYLVGAAAGTPPPAGGVRAIGFNAAGQMLGTVNLAGPATLPVLAAGGTLSDAMRADDAAAFSAELPVAWVQPGLRVRVEAGGVGAPVLTSEASPTVVGSGGLRFVLVPLISGSNVPTLPTAAEVLEHLQRKLPIPAGQITVRIRAPYTLTSANAGVVDGMQWSAALSELERLRDAEAPNDLYYGMVRPLVSSGIAGIGYVNSIGSSSPALASLGWDASRASWPRTMIHELGHNFSRPHAPCGNVASADPNYPYPNGALGPTPLFDILANDVLAPTGQADIMGYCNGNWFSDYNLHAVTRFLEGRPQALKDEGAGAALAVEGRATEMTQEVIVLAGTVNARGDVELAPTRAQRGGAPRATPGAAAAGGHVLRLVMADGGTLEQRFEPTPLDHIPGEAHFVLRLPHPGGRVARVEVLRDDKGARRMIASRVAKPLTAPAAGTTVPSGSGAPTAAAAGPWAEVAREGDALVLNWAAEAYPHASLTLVVGGARQVLALQASSGRWSLPRETERALPAGGEFEVSLSDGVDTVVMVLPRR